MVEPKIELIAGQGEAAQTALLDLNNANAGQTSDEWASLTNQAFCAACIADAAALLIALDQDADYASPNFKWVSERYSRFVYIDRIIVAHTHRGKGLAGDLYRDLFERAQAAGHERIVCEVNLVPPNPVSQAFHAKMGFQEIGQATLAHNGRTVRYLEKRL